MRIISFYYYIIYLNFLFISASKCACVCVCATANRKENEKEQLSVCNIYKIRNAPAHGATVFCIIYTYIFLFFFFYIVSLNLILYAGYRIHPLRMAKIQTVHLIAKEKGSYSADLYIVAIICIYKTRCGIPL